MIAWLALAALAQDDPRDALVRDLCVAHHLTPEQTEAVRAIVMASDRLGTGRPGVTVHPMTPEECADRTPLKAPDPTFEAICGGPWMAPLYDPRTERPTDATACIDQLEFPDIPCAYPVVWVRASEAAGLCEAMGKRLCDAHEWEGACDGKLLAPDYRFDLAAGRTGGDAQKAMRGPHNAAWRDERTWAYGGDHYQKGVCAAASFKPADCDGSDWTKCGSNTYPTGAFPRCVSPLGVYDLHGNAAEHMNLPLTEAQRSTGAASPLGVTEMKGSWFIFDTYVAHEDWCRWRAPYWHGGPVRAPDSHRNYHLGFRCCKTVTPANAP